MEGDAPPAAEGAIPAAPVDGTAPPAEGAPVDGAPPAEGAAPAEGATPATAEGAPAAPPAEGYFYLFLSLSTYLIPVSSILFSPEQYNLIVRQNLN